MGNCEGEKVPLLHFMSVEEAPRTGHASAQRLDPLGFHLPCFKQKMLPPTAPSFPALFNASRHRGPLLPCFCFPWHKLKLILFEMYPSFPSTPSPQLYPPQAFTPLLSVSGLCLIATYSILLSYFFTFLSSVNTLRW